jgi:hypothetical protein
MYHSNGNTFSIPLDEIDDVRHRTETLVGDIIEIDSRSGQTMKIEIAPLNSGQTFRDVLLKAWKRAQGPEATGPEAVE